jgi:hypothetical protein
VSSGRPSTLARSAIGRGGSEVVGVEQWAEVRRMCRVEGLSRLSGSS